VSVYILCIDTLLKEFKTRFKDFEHMKFTVSFITNPFQDRDINESAEFISSVFKENVSELELEIINLQTDLSLKTRLNDTNFWNLMPSTQCPILKRVECMFWFYLLERIRVFNNENSGVKVQIIID